MKESTLRPVLVIISILACTIFITCNSLDVDLNEIEYTDPVKIGLLLPLSIERAGEESAYLSTILAAEEINRAGGIMGRDIEIILKDDGASASIGVQQATNLMTEGVDLVLGPAWSSVTLAVTTNITIPNGMLLMSHSSTSPQITNLSDNGLVWRTAPSDVFQAKIGVDYVYNDSSKRTAGIIYSSSTWSTDLAMAFKSTFEETAGSNSVLSFVSYPEGQDWSTFDFNPYLDELFADQPEAIYLVSYSNDGAKITNDIFYGNYLNNGYDPLFFSNDGPYGYDFLVNGHPDILEGMMGTQPTGPAQDPNYTMYLQNYQDRFGFYPEPFGEHIYDAVYLIAYAALKAGSVSPAAISSELLNVSGGDPDLQGTLININEYARAKMLIESGGDIDYNGASGVIDFDSNGDPGSGTYIIWKVVNGEYVVDRTVIFP
ncbi:MAG: ABC transporter substrate-binding protein [bacterium]|nr:ABC transporter substrate-binding protein [bacterium]